jgi:hypothetical protein
VGIRFAHVLLIAASLGVAPGATLDPREIVRRSVAENQGKNSELALAYNFLERIQNKTLDAKGQVRFATSKSHQVFMIDGTPYRLLVEENGKPIPEERRKDQSLELRRAVESRRQQTQSERLDRLSEFQKRRDRYRRAIQEIPDAFNFRLVGEESVASRPAYVIEAMPRAGYRPIDRSSKLFTQLKGKLWIDKADYQWAKVEAELLETVAFGWIFVRIHGGSRVSLTQTKLPSGVWIPERMWYRVSLRIGLFKVSQFETDTAFAEYRRTEDDPELAP